MFVGNGQSGQIARSTDNGARVINDWVTLPGATGLLRGGVVFDQTGTFGRDLIAVTTSGQVYRVNSAGVATQLAQVASASLEGATVVPNDPGRYVPLAGKVVVPEEAAGSARLFTIDPAGNTASFTLGGIDQLEDIVIVPPKQDFFGVDYANGRVLEAHAAAFAGMAGDILLVQEFTHGSGLYDLTWNGTSLQTQALALGAGSAAAGQWEQVAFAPEAAAPERPAKFVIKNIDDQGKEKSLTMNVSIAVLDSDGKRIPKAALEKLDKYKDLRRGLEIGNKLLSPIVGTGEIQIVSGKDKTVYIARLNLFFVDDSDKKPDFEFKATDYARLSQKADPNRVVVPKKELMKTIIPVPDGTLAFPEYQLEEKGNNVEVTAFAYPKLAKFLAAALHLEPGDKEGELNLLKDEGIQGSFVSPRYYAAWVKYLNDKFPENKYEARRNPQDQKLIEALIELIKKK